MKAQGTRYTWAVVALMAAVAASAWLIEDQWLVYLGAILGLYAVHLLSVRQLARVQAEFLSSLAAASPGPVGPQIAAPPSSTARVRGETPSRNGSADLDDENEAADRKSLWSTVAGRWQKDSVDGPEGAVVVDDEEGQDDVAVAATDDSSSTVAPRDGRPENEGERAAQGEPESETDRDVAIPRHFMLGTVAIVRNVMDPEAVARVLMEQRRQPGKRFGELAVEMAFVSEEQLEDLLAAQQRGLFTDAEIREARQRLEAFRRSQVAPAS